MRRADRKIFIDCGANTGKVLETFIRNRQGYKFYAFEAQPELIATLEKVVAAHPEVPIELNNLAVWTENTKLDFYLATEWSENFRGGSTVLAGHKSNASRIDYDHPVKVDAIDFSRWFAETIKPTPQDYIAIKMDIEGAEYAVLEKLIREDSLQYVSELFVEFHHRMNDSIEEQRHVDLMRKLKGASHLRLVQWF